MALSIAGNLCFNPITDALILPSGERFTFEPPTGDVLPASGYDEGTATFRPPLSPRDRAKLEVVVQPDSERLQLLPRFPGWHGRDFEGLPILIKVGSSQWSLSVSVDRTDQR